MNLSLFHQDGRTGRIIDVDGGYCVVLAEGRSPVFPLLCEADEYAADRGFGHHQSFRRDSQSMPPISSCAGDIFNPTERGA